MNIQLHPDKELIEKYGVLKTKIKRYSTILIFLQKYTDLDAAGSSIGLLNIIKHNYKNKEIYLVGFDVKPWGLQVPEENLFDKDKHIIDESNTLGISVDVPTEKQIKYKDLTKKCREFIIIDHHEDHKLWDEMKQKPILINNNYYGSCCGLLFKIAKHNKWNMCNDVLSLMARGHYADTSLAVAIMGCWEIFDEISKLGIDVNQEIQKVNRRPFYMIKAVRDICCEAEEDGKALILTWTPLMSGRYRELQKTLFTFPLIYLQRNVNKNTLIFFHYLLKEISRKVTLKHIFVVIMNENPELDELLLENGFVMQRNWYYKRGDVMEFKELFMANRSLFTR